MRSWRQVKGSIRPEQANRLGRELLPVIGGAATVEPSGRRRSGAHDPVQVGPEPEWSVPEFDEDVQDLLRAASIETTRAAPRWSSRLFYTLRLPHMDSRTSTNAVVPRHGRNFWLKDAERIGRSGTMLDGLAPVEDEGYLGHCRQPRRGPDRQDVCWTAAALNLKPGIRTRSPTGPDAVPGSDRKGGAA